MKRTAPTFSRHQLEEQFFQIVLAVQFAQLGQGAAGQDASPADDCNPVAQSFDFAMQSSA